MTDVTRFGLEVSVLDETGVSQQEVTVRNEFASVSVQLDTSGNGDRLRIEDLDSERVIYLDALQLENLVWLPQEKLEEYMDPSAHRWRDEQPGQQ